MHIIRNLNVAIVWIVLTGIIVLAQPEANTVQLEFVNDVAMGIPTQDVYIDAGLIMRPASEPMEDMQAYPLYASSEAQLQDYEEPFEIGPFERGEPLGITLGDWVAASGTGTYTRLGERAKLDFQFEHLIPNGLYTLWCLDIVNGAMGEKPCGAPDGSESAFTVDDDGSASISMEIDAFPPSTDDTFYEIAIAYHSDGANNGAVAGDFGKNVHSSIWFDFYVEHNDLEVVEMEFFNESAWGVPIQDVFVDAELVVRPKGNITNDILDLPLYSTATETAYDIDGVFGLEPTFNIGPFAKGVALDITLGEWLAATGDGMYTVNDGRATIDITFEGLVPEGIYTMWCVEILMPPDVAFFEQPCGAIDGSENHVIVDEDGNATFQLEMDAFPDSTETTIYEIALAYHSDGQTYGERAGEFGHNVHVQLVYDFFPSESE